MYEAFYGFSEKPFSMSPDPAFLYLGKKHSVGLSMLRYGLMNRAGITVLTGPIGAGKTTLVRQILNEMDQDFVVGLISNTHKSFGSLMQWVTTAFGLRALSRSKALAHEKFVDYLIAQYSAGKRTALIVDEAQNLDASTLEELRLLTNINADKAQLLQLVLIGQPELRKRLSSPNLEQFVQRIGVDYNLTALSCDETEAYIKHRISVASGPSDLFEPASCRFIHYQAEGVPRLINSLCDTALIYGFAEGASSISAELVHGIVVERLEEGLFGAGISGRGDSDESARKRADRFLRQSMEGVADTQSRPALGHGDDNA